jgi:sugar O-acyltransferase (sialic acid O-acetyltransferase NeuD family)
VRGLLLVAASGLAREVLAVERRMQQFTRIRVLDDDEARWGHEIDGEPVVGGLPLAQEYDDHEILVCAGKGTARRDIVARLDFLGVDPDRYFTLVDPSVVIPDGCSAGAGSIVLAGTVLTASVQLGRHVVAMPNVALTHDVFVEDFATLCAGVSLGGSVHVGEAAYLGMNACVREGLQVGDGATLGMAAALTKDLPAGETWTGVPAGRARATVRRAS